MGPKPFVATLAGLVAAGCAFAPPPVPVAGPAGAPEHTHEGGVHPPTEFIEISFVRVAGEQIRGRLERYRDPVCGCNLDTTFEGILRGDTIVGTFTTVHSEGGMVQSGEWRVERGGPTS